jgi:Arc/MetJ-type ribon-helix-helix transcriptional regulator
LAKVVAAQMSEMDVRRLDELVSEGRYSSRSDAIRSIVRRCIEKPADNA